MFLAHPPIDECHVNTPDFLILGSRIVGIVLWISMNAVFGFCQFGKKENLYWANQRTESVIFVRRFAPNVILTAHQATKLRTYVGWHGDVLLGIRKVSLMVCATGLEPRCLNRYYAHTKSKLNWTNAFPCCFVDIRFNYLNMSKINWSE